MFTKDQILYTKERPEGQLCLGKAKIIIYTTNKTSVKVKVNKSNHRRNSRWRHGHQRRLGVWRKRREQRKTRRRLPGCPRNIATAVERNLKDRVFGKRSELLLSTLRVTEENCSDLKQQKIQKLTTTFWCRSGMECFKPTEEPFENCVEVAIFGMIRLALKAVESRRKIVKVDSEYMTDLSPCYVCRGRLPEQKRKIKKKFRNVTFSYSEDYVIPYEIYKIIKRPRAKLGFNQLLSLLSNLGHTNRGARLLETEFVRLDTAGAL